MSVPPRQVLAGPLAAVANRLVGVHPADTAPSVAPQAARTTSPPPGALVAVATGDDLRYAVAGSAQRIAGREPVPMSWKVRTDAGSLTKIVGTTAALMSLADAGEVILDEPAGRYLAQLAMSAASVRDLLEHRAGLWEWWPLYLTGARNSDAVDVAAALPLRYAPRSGRHYSDLGFILLGELTARVAGAPLTEAVDELALSRFGLTETAYAAPVPAGPVAASSLGDGIEQHMITTRTPYPVTGDVADFDRWRSHVLMGEVNDGNAFHAFGGAAGHAGLFTTAADLLRFGRGVLDSITGAAPVSVTTAATFTAAGTSHKQALGFRRWSTTSGPAIGHTGFPGVAFALLPERDAAVVMITNRLHAAGAPRSTDDMWDAVLRAASDELASMSATEG